MLGIWLCKTQIEVQAIVDNYIEAISKKCGLWNKKLPESSKSRIWNGVINSHIRYAGHWIEIDAAKLQLLDKICGLFLRNGQKWTQKKFMLLPRWKGGCGAILPSQVVVKQRDSILKYIWAGDTHIAEVWQIILSEWATSSFTSSWEKEWLNHSAQLRQTTSKISTIWKSNHWIAQCQWPDTKIMSSTPAIWKSVQHLMILPQARDFVKKYVLNLLPELPWVKYCPWCHVQEGKHFKECKVVEEKMSNNPNWHVLQELLNQHSEIPAILAPTVEQLWHLWKLYIEEKLERCS